MPRTGLARVVTVALCLWQSGCISSPDVVLAPDREGSTAPGAASSPTPAESAAPSPSVAGEPPVDASSGGTDGAAATGDAPPGEEKGKGKEGKGGGKG